MDRGVWTQLSSKIDAAALPDNLETLQKPVTSQQPAQLEFRVGIISGITDWMWAWCKPVIGGLVVHSNMLTLFVLSQTKIFT